MHKHETIINGINISFLTTKASTKNISYINDISINISPAIQNCKALVIEHNKLRLNNIPRLKCDTNGIIAITLSKEVKSTTVLYRLLKKAVPSVFDKQYIRLRNREIVLENDIAVIYQSACAILGNDEVNDLGLKEKYLQCCKNISSDSGVVSFNSEFSQSFSGFE